MNFLALKTRVANEAGLDLTTDDTMIGTWVNAAYKHVCGVFNWPWLMKAGTIQTVADITTGTVSINAGSTALTFSSAPTDSVANQYMIQFTATSDDWYYISSHTAASTSATLANAFVGTSNISGASYILRKVFYSLPSDCDRVVDIRQAVTSQKVYPVNIHTFDAYIPNPTATGEPNNYMMLGRDTSGYWQIGVYPTPTSVMNLQLRYLLTPSDMSSSTTSPLLPENFHDVIVYGALAMFGHPFIDDTRYASAAQRYKETLADMKQNYKPVPDELTVLQPWDQRSYHTHGHLPWPSNYPR